MQGDSEMEAKVGEPAPDFELPAHTGEKIRLSSLRGKRVVLYFYPRAMTPGCTREAETFNAHLDRITELNAVVLGISTDSVNANRRFAEKYGLRFELLSDERGEVAKKYGVLRTRLSKRPSAERVTFIIDENGVIREIIRGVKAEEHPIKAIEALKKITS